MEDEIVGTGSDVTGVTGGGGGGGGGIVEVTGGGGAGVATGGGGGVGKVDSVDLRSVNTSSNCTFSLPLTIPAPKPGPPRCFIKRPCARRTFSRTDVEGLLGGVEGGGGGGGGGGIDDVTVEALGSGAGVEVGGGGGGIDAPTVGTGGGGVAFGGGGGGGVGDDVTTSVVVAFVPLPASIFSLNCCW